MVRLAARAAAAAIASRALVERGRRTVTTGLEALDVEPGAIVAIAGETGRWRVTEAAWEAMAVRLTLVPVAPATLNARPADGGRAATGVDEPAGRTLLRLVELPAADEVPATGPRIGVVANGSGAGWRRAALWWSIDDGASWTEVGDTAAAGVIGTVEFAPRPAPATLFDDAGGMVVRLARDDLTLADADDAALARGANLAAAGVELFQFGRARPLGGGCWRLERLLRGRRGTEAWSAAAGDGVALLEAAAVRVIDLPVAAIGQTLRVMASGIGDDRAVEASRTVDGLAVRPPPPAKLRWTAGGLAWVRRSRAGWAWIDGVDTPLGEEREAYRVTLISRDNRREIETDAPGLALSAEERAVIVRAEVRQRGTWAESDAATIEGEKR